MSRIDLCPTQQMLFDRVAHALPLSPVVVINAAEGTGKSTLLARLREQTGGTVLPTAGMLASLRERHPLAMEEAFLDHAGAALDGTDCLLIDDLHLLTNVVAGGCYFYPRSGLLTMALSALVDRAAGAGKRLLIATSGNTPDPLGSLARAFSLPEFTPDDYAFFGKLFLGADAGRLDIGRIHRFAPGLNARQLRDSCLWLKREGGFDTDRVIAFLREQHLTSNVHLDEVQQVSLKDLHGVTDIVESLEANVVLPLEDDALASELNLKPKRGVLLLGPPGTGKTTVGRALAHRLRGKFFLIDGTCISGTNQFYNHIAEVFDEAKRNAPAVVFIDDSDVIFESGEEMGLYRYLLTMMDGLESAKAGRVCVMMTAMNVASIPPALLRSGRVELWLEMRLPDAAARRAILEHHLTPLPQALASLDVAELSAATDGFTGADLKRLADDGKNLYAHDRARGREMRPVTDYFLAAIAVLRENKARYHEAEERARQHRPERPVYFDVERKDQPTMRRCRVVLVATQTAANLGSVARVMRNFGCDDLVLVAPQCDPRGEHARAVAAHGEALLETCRVVATLDEALADCVLVAGTSARTGGLYRRQTVVSPDAVAPMLAEAMASGVVALVFGNERTGLDNDDIRRCHHLISIPADEAYPALNLAQAVAICVYEVRRAWMGGTADEAEVAPYETQERMFAQLSEALGAARYLRGVRGEALMHALRHLIARARPSPMEVNLLLGLARQVRWLVDHAELPAEDEG